MQVGRYRGDYTNKGTALKQLARDKETALK
jgi:hypothetical protein